MFAALELNNWPRNPTNNFPLKNCFFGTAKLVGNETKSKFIYNGQGITFDVKGSWSFDKDFARNFAIFSIDNSLPSHPDNWKNNLLVLGEGPTDGINNSTGASEKKGLTLV